MDVVAHEFGHGVDDRTPGGISGGGTQEFVGDTFGAATEWFSNNPADAPDYLVGEEINLVGQGPIRNMYNPSAVGDPNCYSSSIPSAEVHAAAGPGNHWFYLLAEGTNPTNGQPTSPTCNSTTLTGVGIQNAPEDHVQRDADEDVDVVVPEVPHLDADLGQEPRRGTAPVQQGQGGVERRLGSGAGRLTRPVARPAASPSPTRATSPARSARRSRPSRCRPPAAPRRTPGRPPACRPGVTIGSSTGTVSGTPTTAGTYNVTVDGDRGSGGSGSGDVVHLHHQRWRRRLLGPEARQPRLRDRLRPHRGSASAGVIDSSASQPAHAGSWKAWLDGYGTTHTDTLSQSVAIPAGLRRDAVVLPAHRLRRDHDHRRRTTS